MEYWKKYYRDMMVYQEELEVELGYRDEIHFPFEDMVSCGLLRPDWEEKAITLAEYNEASALLNKR